MSKQDPDQSASQGEFERITPAKINPGARPGPAPVNRSGNSLPATWVWLALGIFLALGAGVFFWLPQQASQSAAVEQAPPAAQAEVAQSSESPTPPLDAETLLARREQAQTLAMQLSAKRERLAARNVQRWAQAGHTQLEKLAVTAQAQFERRQYTDAIESYSQGIDQADQLLTESEQVLAQALERGAKAYADEDSAAAIQAYELALAVDSDNAAASKGLKRAQSLDSVLEKMRAGAAQEQNQELAAAGASYRAALALDADYSPARAALSRMQSALVGKAYSQQMSRGLAALERGDFAAAQTAFQAAKKTNPGDSGARDGLAQANAGLQQQAISRHQTQAQAAVEQEQWQQAISQYDAALKLDPTLSFAQSGKALASKRLQLDSQLQFHLNNPQRLSDKAAQSSAEAQLQQARSVAQAGPRLRSQIEKLSSLLVSMRKPIPVQLVSDKRTQVLMYHVGDLGSFESKRLELTPGEYTVVGRCPGYRDVRRTITVKADQASVGPISIRCEEKI